MARVRQFRTLCITLLHFASLCITLRQFRALRGAAAQVPPGDRRCRHRWIDTYIHKAARATDGKEKSPAWGRGCRTLYHDIPGGPCVNISNRRLGALGDAMIPRLGAPVNQIISGRCRQPAGIPWPERKF